MFIKGTLETEIGTVFTVWQVDRIFKRSLYRLLWFYLLKSGWTDTRRAVATQKSILSRGITIQPHTITRNIFYTKLH